MRGFIRISDLASTGLLMAFVAGISLGFNQTDTGRAQASYDRVKTHRKTPINSMNCMSGPWNDCVSDIKRAGWAKTYKGGR